METSALEQLEAASTLSHKNTILVDLKVAGMAVNLHTVCMSSLVSLHVRPDQGSKV